ncbi:hypothetical protein [Flavobacterium alkalisoli]|uniref:hypothetical protein n=1 Tax=Flavobacterium alkalisoli TaxID=2602769 RepID=UPI003A8EA810
MESIRFNTTTIEALFGEAERILLDNTNITEALYTDFNPDTFDALNVELLSRAAGNAIVYCLWSGRDRGSMAAKYIGHAAGNISRQRIRAHLTRKNERTGAQLDKVKAVLLEGHCIGITMVRIEPPYMRKALEEWLIAKNSASLSWNRTGKIKGLLKQALGSNPTSNSPLP